MKYYKQLIEELREQRFTNWVKPSKEDLALEYKIEYEIKPLKGMTNNAFPTLDSFLKAANESKVMEITPAIDRKISYRSHTRNKEDLLSLIRGYASYPKFRNEKTIEAIYDGFKNNKPMKMPIVLKFPNGMLRIMGGNTRADVASHLGLNWKALVIEVPDV